MNGTVRGLVPVDSGHARLAKSAGILILVIASRTTKCVMAGMTAWMIVMKTDVMQEIAVWIPSCVSQASMCITAVTAFHVITDVTSTWIVPMGVTRTIVIITVHLVSFHARTER